MLEKENVSSSEEEDDDKLREALDPSMFHRELLVKASTQEKQNEYQRNILNVTPEFQNFVAKRLSDVLDRTIKECRKEKHYEEPDLSSGIQLFSDSTKLLKDKKFYDPLYLDRNRSVPSFSKKKKRKLSLTDNCEVDSDLLEKASAAAVSVEWVLNKEGTKGWSKPKGKEIHVKRSAKGELEILDRPFI